MEHPQNALDAEREQVIDLTETHPDTLRMDGKPVPSRSVTSGETNLAAFGDELTRERQRRKMTQDEFARYVGHPPTTLSNWLKGHTAPEPAKVFAIERVCGMRPGQLSRHLGYLPLEAARTAPGITEAIDSSDLAEHQKDALRAVYRLFGPPDGRRRPTKRS